MALDNRIYGLDENELASSIASDALSAPNSNAHSGSPTGSAPSKGVSHQEQYSETGDVAITSNKSDGRAKSKGN